VEQRERKKEEEKKKDSESYLSMQHIHTLPDPTPTPIIFLKTAEKDGRYSVGSHSTFSELYVIQVKSVLKPPPWYEAHGVVVALGAVSRADDI